VGIIKTLENRLNEINKEKNKLSFEFQEIENSIDKAAREIVYQVIDGISDDDCEYILWALKCEKAHLMWSKVVRFYYCPNEDDHPNDRIQYIYDIPINVFDLDYQEKWIKEERLKLISD
jgi:hypothetical protein